MNRAENPHPQIGHKFSEKLIATVFPVALRELASWEVLALQERDMMGSTGKIRRNIKKYVNTFVDEYRGATRDFSAWTKSRAYEYIDDELLTYKLVSAIEEDFDLNINNFYLKIVNENWYSHVMAKQARIIGDEAADALVLRSQKLGGNIANNLHMTARRMINWGVSKSEKLEDVIIDRTWVNSLGMTVINGERLPNEIREVYKNNPPRVFER